MPKSRIYVLLSDGTKDYIDEEMVKKYDLHTAMRTSSNCELKEDKGE